MIKPEELRLGNAVLYKNLGRISRIYLNPEHFDIIFRKGVADFFPVVLNEKIFIEAGFSENEKYPLRPAAKEFSLPVAVAGSQSNEWKAYQKNNQECFARLMVNAAAVSNNVFHLHHLQNLHFFISGTELLNR